MIGQENREVERKILAILKTLSDSREPLGGMVISRRLEEKGVGLCERAVRYHLKVMDERGLTRCVGRRDGRTITQRGLEELKNALVYDKIGFLTDRIELLTHLTTFDINTNTGNIPIDVSLFAAEDFAAALNAMRGIFKAGLCVSDLIAIASEGNKLGEVVVPEGKIGLATISSVAISGLLLKYGIPLDSRFAGLMEMHNFQPWHFIELIKYRSSTIDPLEIFISSKMTTVNNAVKKGNGRVLASFHEIPVLPRPAVKVALEKLRTINLFNFFVIEEETELTRNISVNSNKLGLIIYSGLNPVAAAAEQGISVVNRVMGGVIDARKLRTY